MAKLSEKQKALGHSAITRKVLGIAESRARESAQPDLTQESLSSSKKPKIEAIALREALLHIGALRTGASKIDTSRNLPQIQADELSVIIQDALANRSEKVENSPYSVIVKKDLPALFTVAAEGDAWHVRPELMMIPKDRARAWVNHMLTAAICAEYIDPAIEKGVRQIAGLYRSFSALLRREPESELGAMPLAKAISELEKLGIEMSAHRIAVYRIAGLAVDWTTTQTRFKSAASQYKFLAERILQPNFLPANLLSRVAEMAQLSESETIKLLTSPHLLDESETARADSPSRDLSNLHIYDEHGPRLQGDVRYLSRIPLVLQYSIERLSAHLAYLRDAQKVIAQASDHSGERHFELGDFAACHPMEIEFFNLDKNLKKASTEKLVRNPHIVYAPHTLAVISHERSRSEAHERRFLPQNLHETRVKLPKNEWIKLKAHYVKCCGALPERIRKIKRLQTAFEKLRRAELLDCGNWEKAVRCVIPEAPETPAVWRHLANLPNQGELDIFCRLTNLSPSEAAKAYVESSSLAKFISDGNPHLMARLVTAVNFFEQSELRKLFMGRLAFNEDTVPIKRIILGHSSRSEKVSLEDLLSALVSDDLTLGYPQGALFNRAFEDTDVLRFIKRQDLAVSMESRVARHVTADEFHVERLLTVQAVLHAHRKLCSERSRPIDPALFSQLGWEISGERYKYLKDKSIQPWYEKNSEIATFLNTCSLVKPLAATKLATPEPLSSALARNDRALQFIRTQGGSVEFDAIGPQEVDVALERISYYINRLRFRIECLKVWADEYPELIPPKLDFESFSAFVVDIVGDGSTRTSSSKRLPRMPSCLEALYGFELYRGIIQRLGNGAEFKAVTDRANVWDRIEFFGRLRRSPRFEELKTLNDRQNESDFAASLLNAAIVEIALAGKLHDEPNSSIARDLAIPILEGMIGRDSQLFCEAASETNLDFLMRVPQLRSSVSASLTQLETRQVSEGDPVASLLKGFLAIGSSAGKQFKQRMLRLANSTFEKAPQVLFDGNVSADSTDLIRVQRAFSALMLHGSDESRARALETLRAQVAQYHSLTTAHLERSLTLLAEAAQFQSADQVRKSWLELTREAWVKSIGDDSLEMARWNVFLRAELERNKDAPSRIVEFVRCIVHDSKVAKAVMLRPDLDGQIRTSLLNDTDKTVLAAALTEIGSAGFQEIRANITGDATRAALGEIQESVRRLIQARIEYFKILKTYSNRLTLRNPNNPALVMPNYYLRLGLQRDADANAIATSFRIIKVMLHPDLMAEHFTDELKFAFNQAEEAYRILSTPSLKIRYDAELAAKCGLRDPRDRKHFVTHNWYADLLRDKLFAMKHVSDAETQIKEKAASAKTGQQPRLLS